MSDINEFMGPVQDQYTQTYVSQYVPMPFEIMQRKAENEQKQFDAIQSNWETISAKMGEKVLAVDQPMMKEEVAKYKNSIDNALKAADGDWRQLSSTVKGVAAEYRDFITTGDGATAISRYNEMNTKLKDIKEKEGLGSTMKKKQSNFIRNEYNKGGGVRGNKNNPEGNTQIEDPILYDESEMQDTLVDWISKLKPDKHAKIEKGKDGKWYVTGAPYSKWNPEKQMMEIFQTDVKELSADKIRFVAQGLYDDPQFKDMVAAGLMVGDNLGIKVPVKNKKTGKMEYQEKDLTPEEFAQYKFAKKAGFTDAYAYAQEETKYNIKNNAIKAQEAKKKAEEETEGIIKIEGSTPSTLEVDDRGVDPDDIYQTKYDNVKEGNKKFITGVSGNVAYENFKSFYKNQQDKTVSDSDIKKEWDTKWLDFFEGENDLKKYIKLENREKKITDEGYNHLINTIAEGDTKLLEKMVDENGGKIFTTIKEANDFKTRAEAQQKKVYLDEMALKQNLEDLIANEQLTTESGLVQIKNENIATQDKYQLIASGLINRGMLNYIDENNPDADKLKTINEKDVEALKSNLNGYVNTKKDFRSENYKKSSSPHRNLGPNTARLYNQHSMYRKSRVLLNRAHEAISDAIKSTKSEDQLDGENFNKTWEESIIKYSNENAAAKKFIANLGGGWSDKEGKLLDADKLDVNYKKGLKIFKESMLLLNKKEQEWIEGTDKEAKLIHNMIDENKQELLSENMKEKVEAKRSVNLNTTNTLELVPANGVGDNVKIDSEYLYDNILKPKAEEILKGSYFTSIHSDTKSKVSDAIPKNQNLNATEELQYLSTALEGAVFSKDINPNTNQTEVIFSLGDKTFRIPYAINRDPGGGGFNIVVEEGDKKWVEKKSDLIERKLRNDIYTAMGSGLNRFPIGNYPDGVVLTTKTPTETEEFGKTFDFDFADGSSYKVSIDPTKLGIIIPKGDGVLKNLNIIEKPEVFLKTYKELTELENNPARLEAYYKKYPKDKGKSAKEIARDYIKMKIYKQFPNQSVPEGLEDVNITFDTFRYGLKYSEGRRPSTFRRYSYPDGLGGEQNNQENSMSEDDLSNWLSGWADSSSVRNTETEKPFEPYRFTEEEKESIALDNQEQEQEQARLGMLQSTMGSDSPAINQFSNMWRDTNFNQFDQPYIADSDTTSTSIPTIREDGYTHVEDQTPEQLKTIDNTVNDTIKNSGLLSSKLEQIDSSSVEGGEDALNNIRQDPETNAQLENLGIEGDVTPESLATDLSPYQYEVSDVQTRETYTIDGTPPSEKFLGFALPGQNDPTPEFLEHPDVFTDQKQVGDKIVSTGVIRKDNLVEFSKTSNATPIIKAAANYAHMGYNNGSKLNIDTSKTSNIDCSGFTHSILNTLGYDLSGNGQFKPTGKLQVDKKGAPMYSGLLWHNSFNKQHFKKTSEIKLDQLKEGQVICFDLGLSDWEGEWRNQGKGQGIDHVGMITFIKGVPYIQESSSNRNMQGPALMKLEDRLKQLSHRLDNPHYKRRFKTVAGEGEILHNGKVYKTTPSLDKDGNPIYKTDKNNKFILDENKKKIPVMKRTGNALGEDTEILKPTIFIGEYKKKGSSDENGLETMIAFE